MGWFWDSKSNSGSEGANGDAYQNLDPSLRDFLDKQTPVNTEQRATPPPSQQQPSRIRSETPRQPQLHLDGPDSTQSTAPSDGRPAVPSESLYQDGRYADLWKTYQSPAQVEASSGSPQDRLTGVLDTIRDRKAAIGRAALENCIEEQIEEHECFKNGGWMDKMTMCRTQSRQFNRCYSMQSRFLKALGYLSSQYTSERDEEKIQMHADRLYHEMLERERIMNEAKEAGREVPTFEALIAGDTTTRVLGEESAWARARRKAQSEGLSTHLKDLSPEKQTEVKERLRNLTPSEREVELQLLAAESRAMKEYTEQIDQELQEEKRHREERRERGRETVGDSLKRLWGYGKG